MDINLPLTGRQGFRFLACLVLACLSLSVAAVDYPDRPIRMIVSVQAGGSTDTAARLIGQKLSEQLGQPILIENKPGAGTRIGTEYVMKARPDGYTLGYFFGISGLFQLMFDDYPALQPGKDFDAITLVTRAPTFLAVNATLPIKNVADFVAYAHAHNGKISYGHSGTASTPNLAAMAFLKSLGVTGVGVPYKGSGPTVTAIAAGDINFGVVDYTAARPLVERGMVRLLAIMEPKRSALQPNVPTAGEEGIARTADGIAPWTVLVAPPGTPPAVIATLNKHVVEILKMPDVQTRLRAEGIEIDGSTPAHAAATYQAERKKMMELIRDLGVSLKN